MKVPSKLIHEEISRNGQISFERFMEIALYCPETGYYETEKDIVGRRGDFVTSVSTGSLFGELLAFQFAGWLEEWQVQIPAPKIIEAGAHDGKLAADILNWLQRHRESLFSRLEYWIIEPSARRQRWQRETLKPFANVRWAASVSALSETARPAGILFGNELLDAFPVRRFSWDAVGKTWHELGVTLAHETLAWTRMNQERPPSNLPFAMRQLPGELLAVLPDSYIVEDSPGAETWWRQAAAALQRGNLVAIDYGFTTDEMISPGRTRGTLRAYHRQQVSNDVLANPGEQDLTAHVNFSAIQRAGEAAGLTTKDFCPQPRFLTRILQNAIRQGHFASLNASQIRQFQTLTHPEHLGRAFRVLVQGR
jgi:SAM-dependent MidA family methyltransferase